MKKTLWIIFFVSIVFLTWCSLKFEENTQIKKTDLSWGVLDFLEKTIEESENCSRENKEKMFVSFALLWTDINSNWNIEYYLVTRWEWMYIDKRWNISSSCGFWWIPTNIELTKSQTGFSLVNYQIAKDGNLYLSSTKEMFSSEAFKKRKNNNYTYNTDKSPLQRAEKHFWIKFWTGWDFECKFCDKNRYNLWYSDEEKLKKWLEESYVIYTNNKNNKDRYLNFKKDWTFENHNSRDEWTGIRIFWKDDKTILVDAYPYHTYDRYIIKYLSGDVIHLTREILQK